MSGAKAFVVALATALAIAAYVAFAAYVLLLVLTAIFHPPAAHAMEPDDAPTVLVVIQEGRRFTPDDVREAMNQHSARVRCLTRQEVGGTTPAYDPYAISPYGDLGAAQLNPRGKLPRFLAAGYTNPFDPYQALDFEESEILLDPGAWTPLRLGMC